MAPQEDIPSWFKENAPPASAAPSDTTPSWFRENAPPVSLEVYKQDPEKAVKARMSPTQQQAYQKIGQTVSERERKAAPPEDPGFFGTLGKDVMAFGSRLAMAPFHPVDTAVGTIKGMGHAQLDELDKASQQWGQGNTSEALGHILAFATPIIGPAASQIGEEIGNQQYGAAAAHLLELLGPEATRLMPKKIGPMLQEIKNRPPVEREAVEAFEQRGGRVSAGQQTGSVRTQKLERQLVNFPGSGGRAEEFFGGQEAELERQGRESIAKAAPGKLLPYQSGKDAIGQLENYTNATKAQADRLYNLIRQKTGAAKVRAKTGAARTLEIDPVTKAPSYVEKPVFEEFEAPADVERIRKGLEPVWEELRDNPPEVRGQVAPAYNVLKNLMTSGKKFMNAVDLDRQLGAVKELVRRSAKSGVLTSRAEALGFKVIDAGEKELASALDKVDPTLRKRLDQARKLVTEYHAVDELREGLGTEPARAYDALTVAGDRAYELLNRIYQRSPQAVRTLGRTYLEGLLERATQKGGFKRAAGVYKSWADLGANTKQLMFGRQLTEELDKFFTAADKLAPAEGSATAGRVAVLGSMGVLAGQVIRELFVGGPLAASKELAAGVGAAYVLPNIAARVLFTPGGAKLMTGVLTLPSTSPAWRIAAMALGARVSLAQKQEREDRIAGSAPTPALPAAARPPQATAPAERKPSPWAGRQQVPPAAPPAQAEPTATPARQPRAALARFQPTFAEVGARHGVPPALLRVVARLESGGDPNAVSRAGAQGLMQFMPATARAYGVRDPFNPEQSIEGAARFLRDLMRKYQGNVAKVLAAYNAGEPRVDRGRALPRETREYVARGLRLLKREPEPAASD